jgi:hypothetical protein
MAANEVSRFLVKDGMAVNGRYILCLYEVNILHCFVLFFSMPFLCLEEGCARYGKDLGNAFNLGWHNNRKHNGPDDARWPKPLPRGVKNYNAVKPLSQMLTNSGARNRKRQRTAELSKALAMQRATGEVDMTDTLAAVANLHKKRVDATSLAKSLNGGETVRKLQDEAV